MSLRAEMGDRDEPIECRVRLVKERLVSEIDVVAVLRGSVLCAGSADSVDLGRRHRRRRRHAPLRQLVIDAKADDILLVQVTPETQEDVPRLSRDIDRRVSQIAFNSPLQKEVEALADLRELCKKGRIFRSRLCHKLQRLRLHRIAAQDGVEGLGQASALNLDWSFLTRLKEAGYQAAEQWQASIPRH